MDEISTIDALILFKPSIARIKDEEGQYPLYHAIQNGLDWAKGFNTIIEAVPESISYPSRSTGLYPFMHAAEESLSNDLPLVVSYCLLKADPDLVKVGIVRETTKTKRRQLLIKNEDDDLKQDGDKSKRSRTIHP
uniref:Uncharacterized protein n=1 Tax=Leptocylindrus danicus TaxID=163516 RepID=A0A7S2P1L7_9STRA|mmetsp:Transcript_20309/g.30284  ORF Transcript_20309/g.30284 Transcript_20309/m.30284 type:complete len:135 (+) Transcript_20309:282-686(+)